MDKSSDSVYYVRRVIFIIFILIITVSFFLGKARSEPEIVVAAASACTFFSLFLILKNKTKEIANGIIKKISGELENAIAHKTSAEISKKEADLKKLEIDKKIEQLITEANSSAASQEEQIKRDMELLQKSMDEAIRTGIAFKKDRYNKMVVDFLLQKTESKIISHFSKRSISTNNNSKEIQRLLQNLPDKI